MYRTTQATIEGPFKFTSKSPSNPFERTLEAMALADAEKEMESEGSFLALKFLDLLEM